MFLKAFLNLKSEASINRLSYAWWVIEPVLYMVVYYIVFEVLLRRGGDGYAVFLLIGLIPWLWFAKSVSHCSSSLIAGAQLMSQVKISKVFFPFVYLLQDFIKQLCVFVLLVMVSLGFSGEGDFSYIYLFPIILTNFLLVMVCGLFVAAIIPLIRDLLFIVPTGLQFLMFMSGVFFDYKSVPENFREIFLLNPIAFLLKSYRDVLMSHTSPDLYHLSVLFFVLVVMLIFVLIVFKKYDHVYPRLVLE